MFLEILAVPLHFGENDGFPDVIGERCAATVFISFADPEFRVPAGVETARLTEDLKEAVAPKSFMMIAGFGDGAPGYIPTDQCWRDGYADDYCWVKPMTEHRILSALAEAMGRNKR